MCDSSCSGFGVDILQFFYLIPDSRLYQPWILTGPIHPLAIVVRRNGGEDLPGRRTIHIPASLAASYSGCSALNPSKSITPGAGLIKPMWV